ncbi:MAG: hypothetical protein QXI10_03515 [Candidatus Diapherotrites archaeon]
MLIVYGDEGLGNPFFLAEVLRSPRISARVKLIDLESVSLPLLQEHQLVIVERAKEISVDELIMFQEYVLKGGKLVWIFAVSRIRRGFYLGIYLSAFL